MSASTLYESDVIIDLFDQGDAKRRANEMLEVNGQAVSVLDALSAASSMFERNYAMRSLIDSCLVEQAMAEYAAAGKMSARAASFDQIVTAFKQRIIAERIDDWWARNCTDLEVISGAWVSLGDADAPVSVLAGKLASNPTAAVVSARTEGRRGGLIEFEMGALPSEFDSLKGSPIGAVAPLHVSGAAIAIVVDRFPTPLNAVTRPRFEQRVLEDWLAERRSTAKVRWIWTDGKDRS